MSDAVNGFSTAAGKIVTVSSDTMAKGRAFFEDFENDDDCDLFERETGNGFDFQSTTKNSSAAAFSGFKSAGGKTMAISSDAMAKGQAFFKDLEHDDFDCPGFGKPAMVGIGFQSAKTTPSDSSADGASTAFSGFKLAGGGRLTISSDVMAKGQAFFKDLENDDAIGDECGFQAAPKNPSDQSAFSGFKLAGGAKVTIGSNAMAKGQAFFKDLDSEDFNGLDFGQLKQRGNGCGFQTAAKTPLDFKTPDFPLVQKKAENFDSTPKLPAQFKLPLGRRRLADTAPSSESIAAAKKKRFSLFNRMDAMEEFSTPKPTSSHISSAPALLTQLPRGRPSFQYSSQNRKKTPVPVLFSKEATPLDKETIRKNYKRIVDQPADDDLDQPRKVELGKLYRERKDQGRPRTTLAAALAGQTPRIYDQDYYELYGVKRATLEVNSQNAQTFAFTKDYFVVDSDGCSDHNRLVIGDGVTVELNENGTVTAEEFVRAFMHSPLVDPKLISEAWCLNHYRWIVWKESAMEAGFPHLFGGKLLTPDRVMLQLKYRYDREIGMAERSCLKRILNGDDSTYRPMVLCISAVLLEKHVDAPIEVTDGWYAVKARLDVPLSQRLAQGQMFVGQKLFISRCAINGVESGFDPLEVPANVQLVLTSNSVRRARWNAVLGYQKTKGAVRFPLSSLIIGGGTVAAVEVLVQKVHPMLYMVKNSSGSTMIMDEKVEARDAQVFQEHYDRCLEKLVEEVEKGLTTEAESTEDESETDDGGKMILRTQEIRAIYDVQELYRLITKAADPDTVANRITATQKERVNAFCAKVNDKRAHRFHDKVEKAIREKAARLPQRMVTPFLKMRVGGCHPKDVALKVAPILTIWKPNEDTLYHVKEGMAYLVTNVQVMQPSTAQDSCKFALATTVETRFIPKEKKVLKE